MAGAMAAMTPGEITGGGGGRMRLVRVSSLTQQQVARLAARRIHTAQELLTRPVVDLVDLLDLSVEEVTSILNLVSKRVSPPFTPALQISQAKSGGPRVLPLGDDRVDAMLRGGIGKGTLTELVGPAGMGKTQFSLMVAIGATLSPARGGLGGRALYIDTEGKFSSTRLLQIATTRFPDLFGTVQEKEKLAKNVFVMNPRSCAELMQLLSSIQGLIIEHSIKCIIVDSVAALPRTEYGSSRIVERQELLGRQAILLKNLAEAFDLPVLVTNQVTTRIQESHVGVVPTERADSHLMAALGVKWAHCVNTRILLHNPQADGSRSIEVVKSPCISCSRITYRITIGGIESENAPAENVPAAREGRILFNHV